MVIPRRVQREQDKLQVYRSERWSKNPTSESIEIPPLSENGQQILLKGLDRITVNKEPAETVMKEMAAGLQKESEAILRQVKAVEG